MTAGLSPDIGRLRADDSWRAVDFISDLHLGVATPATFDAWRAHLLHTPADAVVMLGDLFEVWIGDDTRDQPFEHRCVQTMHDASLQRDLFFMAGNRDFLVGPELLREAGVYGLADPTLLEAFGQRLLLSHGDALCLEDVEYQAFRQEVRSPSWRSAFLARPLADRAATARHLREQSQARKDALPRPELWADVDATAAVVWLQHAGATTLIHGHTHRPGSAMLRPGFERHVLSDWDLEAPVPRAEVLRLDAGGLRRVPRSLAP